MILILVYWEAIRQKNAGDPDALLESKHPDLVVFEQVYVARHSPLYGKIKQIEKLASTHAEQEEIKVNVEWFMELAEQIAFQEQTHNRALRALDVVKRNTQEEIYRRLLLGKEYMNEHFLQNPVISEVAQQCYMSEFYFFRCFKQAFGTTPHQYMLQRRLKFATDLMRQKQISISRVAIECGFPDLSTFSKTFKKHYQMTPTQFVVSI